MPTDDKIKTTTTQDHKTIGQRAIGTDGAEYTMADIDDRIGDTVHYVDGGVNPPVIRPAILLLVENVSKAQADWMAAHPGQTSEQYRAAMRDLFKGQLPPQPANEERVDLATLAAFGRGTGCWIVEGVPRQDVVKDEPWKAKTYHERS